MSDVLTDTNTTVNLNTPESDLASQTVSDTFDTSRAMVVESMTRGLAAIESLSVLGVEIPDIVGPALDIPTITVPPADVPPSTLSR